MKLLGEAMALYWQGTNLQEHSASDVILSQVFGKNLEKQDINQPVWILIEQNGFSKTQDCASGIWFGLISLFNGISHFMDYFMSKPTL